MNANRIMGGGPAFQKGIADKPKMKTSQILKRLWKYLYHFKWFLFLALFMTLTSNILALTGPKLSGMGCRCHPRKRQCGISKGLFLLWHDACLLRNLCPV